MADHDVTTTLRELEDKLRALEDELKGTPSEAAAGAPAPAPTPVPPPTPAPAPIAAAPAPVAPPVPGPVAPAAPVGELDVHLARLDQFRDQLERSAQELVSEYERVIGSLRGAAAHVAAPAPILPPAPADPVAATPAPTLPPPAPWQPPPTASPATSPGDVALEGAITVDAGPFTGIDGLSGFEQTLASIPGVDDVYVRGFEGDRAMIDLTAAAPVAFGPALQQVSTVPFTITAAGPGHLAVSLEPGA